MYVKITIFQLIDTQIMYLNFSLTFPNLLKIGESYFLQLFNPGNPRGKCCNFESSSKFDVRIGEIWGFYSVIQTRKIVKWLDKTNYFNHFIGVLIASGRQWLKLFPRSFPNLRLLTSFDKILQNTTQRRSESIVNSYK